MLFGQYVWNGRGVANCDNYRLFRQDHGRFWQNYLNRMPDLSEELIDLLNKCFNPDQAERITFEEILAHPWYSLPTPNDEEVKLNMIGRLQRLGLIPSYDPAIILPLIPEDATRGEEELKGLEMNNYIEDDVHGHKVLFTNPSQTDVY